jgi:sugar O-acyltransferase (sialic acid O-acetyltransferase NeuD family)
VDLRKRIVILGTGGNSVDILDTLNDINEAASSPVYECVGFLDDNESLWGKRILNAEVLGPLEKARYLQDCLFVNGIGAPTNFWKKEAIIGKTGAAPDQFETVIHPSASVSRTAKLGRGVVVFQHVVITSNVRVGDHVIILPNTVISHDDVIGDYTCIAGGVCISGQAKIGRSCYLGTNSTIIGNSEVGDLCLVGMGSCVLRNVPANSVVVGNPARFLRHTIEGSEGMSTGKACGAESVIH